MEELQSEKESEALTQTIEREETTEKQSLNPFLHIDDMLKSEQELNTMTQMQGLVQVENNSILEDKPFMHKKDEKKAFIKKRIKVIAGVYIAVLTMLLTFVGINAVTLILLNKDITSNKETINVESERVEMARQQAEEQASGEEIQIVLNEPRDYQDDNIELSVLDKISIIFKNLFG